jgi:hypothetical protein
MSEEAGQGKKCCGEPLATQASNDLAEREGRHEASVTSNCARSKTFELQGSEREVT